MTLYAEDLVHAPDGTYLQRWACEPPELGETFVAVEETWLDEPGKVPVRIIGCWRPGDPPDRLEKRA